ncbi:MAG: molecular chaperone DnaK [Planctomycetota bacterium]
MELTIVGANSSSSEATILGIDLGTTFSLAATMTDSGPEMIRDETGDARVPSVLGFESDGSVTVGKTAKKHAVSDPLHTVYSVKRLIGKTMGELAAELPYVPYQVVERQVGPDRKVLVVRINDAEHTPEELSAMILKEVVRRAEAKLGKSVLKVVITVPAYFDESQRQATRDAGRLAGLDVIRIINEPTAAALAYGLQERKDGLVAVYDFGGGTFDCSVLQLQQGVFKVLSTHGDTHLGGDDVDRAIMEKMEQELETKIVAIDASVRQAVRDASERLKIELTLKDQAEFVLELPSVRFSHRRRVTRDELESWISPLVERTLSSCKAALRDAGYKATQMDEVVLVGGSSRIPLVRRRVEELFGRRPHTELNPDEVVALGAAVQASILSGQLRQILLLDITPLSLGIETMGGAVSKLIARNSTIPAQATERYTTWVDNQTGVDIHIVQGERELAKDCRSLGKFKLSGIPPMPAGLPQVDVTFMIDANGMLHVTARELKSGTNASIEIQPSHGLSREEVDRMIRDSILSAEADFAARKLVELRNKAENNLRHTSKGLKSAGDQLSAEQRQAIDAAVAATQRAAEMDDVAELQAALDRLDAATLPLAEILLNSVAKAEVVHKKLNEL